MRTCLKSAWIKPKLICAKKRRTFFFLKRRTMRNQINRMMRLVTDRRALFTLCLRPLWLDALNNPVPIIPAGYNEWRNDTFRLPSTITRGDGAMFACPNIWLMHNIFVFQLQLVHRFSTHAKFYFWLIYWIMELIK